MAKSKTIGVCVAHRGSAWDLFRKAKRPLIDDGGTVLYFDPEAAAPGQVHKAVDVVLLDGDHSKAEMIAEAYTKAKKPVVNMSECKSVADVINAVSGKKAKEAANA